MLQKFLLTPGVGDVAARRLLDACNRPAQVVVGRRCVFSRLPFCNCIHLRSIFNSECRRGKSGAPVWPPVQLTVQTSVLPSPSRARLHFSAKSTESSPLDETHAVSLDSPEMRGSTAKGAQREGGQHVKWQRAQATDCQQPQPASSSACGLSYSKFVRKCSDWLTDRQLERVAVRLKAYKCLKKAPRPHNKLAAVRDIGKIVPKEHRGELMKLLADSLDLVDPHHFLRLSKASSDRIATQDEVGDGMPQSIMGDYTVGKDMSVEEMNSYLCKFCAITLQAFSGCGKIKKLEIFDDRLRTLDQTEDNTLQAKGEQAIRDKLERRFSPIFALAEFSSTQEKQNACRTYLRTFGVPCIDRLVYPEDAAVKTTLIATNLPFILTPDEVARILSFALVRDAVAPVEYPAVCRIRMTNPKLFGKKRETTRTLADALVPLGKRLTLVATLVLTNRLVLNNDGLFVLRFASFEAAEAAVRRCRGAVIYDSKALLLFSPRRCVFHNGQLVDFVIPEGNFAAESKHFVARG
ncbi:hypothetical protein, conserved [Eimeria maxima]|uniref:Uncharacterized protein n=1 Tax=Eimeria maxima TaxID=5804 RepID=U6MET4_EIMMA|nr:hypothetical protein, conserved [Eimeria maxima]CDJ61548.1 hypothetical protein, conserved [Eimeria maxima]